MAENTNQQNVSLMDIFYILLRYKKLILLITFCAGIFAFVFSLVSIKMPPEKSFLPNKYTSKATMIISETNTTNSTLQSLSSSALGNIVGFSNINLGASNSGLAQQLVTSNLILDKLAKDYDIQTKYKINKYPIANSRQVLKEHLSSSYDEESGLFTISYTDIDGEFAKNITNSTVNYLEGLFNDIGLDENKRNKENLEENIAKTYEQLNSLQKQLNKVSNSVNYYSPYDNSNSVVQDVELLKLEIEVQQQIYTQLKSQYEMLKINMESQRPVFQILEYGQVPDKKSGPSRGKLCIMIVFIAFFISMFIALFANALKNTKIGIK